jgi:CubicO group peptidase (beta-lactamase class C family)
MKRLSIVVVVALLWQLTFCQTKQKDDDVTSKIQQVENGLRYAIHIGGEPSPTFTITERMKHYGTPAVSIALINDGKIEWAKAYGYLGVDIKKKADTLTLFQAASISKAVSALAALQLVEQRKIDLDEDVNTYLRTWKLENTSFTEKKSVTLRGLLTHTAGLTVHGFNGYAQGEALPTLVQILNGEEPANSPTVMSDLIPGTQWRYSGGGYVLMQQLLEDVTGRDFPTLMQRSVLSAIGMKRSTFQQILPPLWKKQASIGHQSGGEKVPGNWHIYPESAPAGLWTTPSDLARFVIEIQKSLQNESNRVLSKQMTENMLTKHLGDWGLGPALYGDADSFAFGHDGANEGFRCFSLGFAYSGKGAVIMTNSNDGTYLIGEIVGSIAIAYNWSMHKPVTKTVVKLIPSKLATFAGTYLMNQLNLNLLVTVQDDHLLVKQLWNGSEFFLYPESDLDFFIKENGVLIKFESSTDGIITGLLTLGLQWTRIEQGQIPDFITEK